MNANDLLLADNGVYYVADTVEAVKDAWGIWVGEDTVFARIEVDGDTGTDVRSTYLQPVGGTVKAGTLITPQNPHDYFSAVTLTSGSVALILKDA